MKINEKLMQASGSLGLPTAWKVIVPDALPGNVFEVYSVVPIALMGKPGFNAA